MSTCSPNSGDGPFGLSRGGCAPSAFTARDTLRLNAQGGDVVLFLASGQVEESISDGAGKVLLTRRPAAGDLVILPAPRTRDRYQTAIYGLTDAVLLTLDRDGLMEGLGPDVEKVALALDRLWEQEVSAVERGRSPEVFARRRPDRRLFLRQRRIRRPPRWPSTPPRSLPASSPGRCSSSTFPHPLAMPRCSPT